MTSIETVAKGLAQCVHEGLAKTVGVSNYSKEDMIRMYDGACISLSYPHFGDLD